MTVQTTCLSPHPLRSAVMTFLATEDVYGPALYVVMPNMAPTAAQDNGTRLAELQARLPMIEEGLGRTAYEQVSCI